MLNSPATLLRNLLIIISLVLFSAACGGEQKDDVYSETPPTIYDEFMDNLRAACGGAYPGGLTQEPEGDDMLEGDELLIAHFVECAPDEDVVKIAFHIETGPDEWDRSRTWIFERTPRGLDIRHDHREEDGSPSEVTMYGGPSRAQVEINENRMEFISIERTEETGMARGWRVLMEPGERYVYGTYRGQDWSWRVDFDLSETAETPPPAWGQGEDSEA